MLHVVHFDLERGWRGGQRQLVYLVAGLAACGYRQTVVCRRAGALAERLPVHNEVVVCPVAGRASAWWHARRIQADIYHAHTGNTIPLAVYSGGLSVVTRRMVLPAKKFFITRADAVVAISNAVRDSLRRSGVLEDRLHLIPSAVAPEQPGNTQVSRALPPGIPAHAKIVLAIGALEPEKDPAAAVKMLTHLDKTIHLVWVGDGTLRAQTAQLAEAAGITDRVHLVGFDPHPNAWFRHADVFILPSRHEGLGTVCLDAFVHGVPVVGSDIPGTRDILLDRRTALRTPPGDAQALAAAVREILVDETLQRLLIEQATAHLAGHRVEAMVSAYDTLYRQLT